VQAKSQSGYGNLVELRHDNGVSTRYAHLSRIDVKIGQKVARHDPIGRIGNTGRSTGPHLHYEILVSGKPVDPRRFWRVGENVLKAQKQ
jgi:murein DD-endopeptidase MepM/ murein hydrolase activator NlpD